MADDTLGISERRSGNDRFLTSDLKSTDVQTLAAGGASAKRTYDAFGKVVSSTGTWNGPSGYGGAFGYQEDGNGLTLLGHRWYDAEVGRFLTRDPARDGRNWYAYCGNDPINGADPEGLTDSVRAYIINLWKTYKDPKVILEEIDDLIQQGMIKQARMRAVQRARDFYEQMEKDWSTIQRVTQHVREKGSPPRGLSGGRKFWNNEKKLPRRGDYREWDVFPPTSKGRGPERIVTDGGGNAWYTPNHYKDFFPLP